MSLSPSASPSGKHPPTYPGGTVLTDSHGRRYTLTRRVGEGGFAEVYAAQRHSSNRFWKPVAVKLLHPGAGREAEGRLRDEANLLSEVSHKHRAVLKLEELVTLDDKLALVTEFVEGENLSACIRGPDRLPVPALLEVIREVSNALEAANAVHRDLKPSNIRIERTGGVKVLDFGIAYHGEVEREVKTATMGVIGTMPYIAPERFTSGEFLPASDQFALGCILFEGISGQRFLHLESGIIALLHASERDWAAFSADRLTHPTVLEQPSGIQDLLRGLLDYQPGRRPTARETSERCDALIRAQPAALGLEAWCRQRQWPDEAYFEVPGQRRSIPKAPPPEVLTNSTLQQRLSTTQQGSTTGPAKNRPPVALIVAVMLAGVAWVTVATVVLWPRSGPVPVAAPVAAPAATPVIAPATPLPDPEPVGRPKEVVSEPSNEVSKVKAEGTGRVVPTGREEVSSTAKPPPPQPKSGSVTFRWKAEIGAKVELHSKKAGIQPIALVEGEAVAVPEGTYEIRVYADAASPTAAPEPAELQVVGGRNYSMVCYQSSATCTH